MSTTTSSPATPPQPRSPGPYRIALICLGNICRSPMADVVLADRITAAGLDDRVEVISAGTGDWHVGDPMDRRAAALLSAHDYDPSRHRAKQVAAAWLTSYDLVLAMDEANLRDLRGLVPSDRFDPTRVRLFRDFDPDGPGEVPDPYYGGDDGFAEVLAMVERTSEAIVTRLPDLG